MSEPQEAALLRRLREESGLSIREAARRAGVSDGTWRRAEGGRPDIDRPAPTLAAMAAVVGALPADLERAGRPDAAGALEKRMRDAAQAPDVAEAVGAAAGDGWAALMSEIMQALAEIDASRLAPDLKAHVRAEMLSGLARDAAERRRQFRSLRRIAGGA